MTEAVGDAFAVENVATVEQFLFEFFQIARIEGRYILGFAHGSSLGRVNFFWFYGLQGRAVKNRINSAQHRVELNGLTIVQAARNILASLTRAPMRRLMPKNVEHERNASMKRVLFAALALLLISPHLAGAQEKYIAS